MKKRNIIIIVIIALALVIVLMSCQKKDKEPSFIFDPADSAIYYESGAMHEEWGKYTLEIKKGGESTYNEYENLEVKENRSFQTSETELAKILKIAEENDFLLLKDVYTDPMILDGGYDMITIYYGDNAKTVRLNNYHFEQFTNIEMEIAKLVKEKTGIDF